MQDILKEIDGETPETARNIIFTRLVEKYGFIQTLDYLYKGQWSICYRDDGIIEVAPTVPIDQIINTTYQ